MTITIDCPVCEAELTLRLVVNGRTTPASSSGPAERATLGLERDIPAVCPDCGHEYDAVEMEALERAAAREIADWTLCRRVA